MAEVFDSRDLADGLERVSADIKREVGALIPQTAYAFVAALVARYPTGRREHPGVPHMEDDIAISTQTSNDPLLPSKRVRGPHLAYIWQNGTADRAYVNARGTLHRTGHARPQDPDFYERTAAQQRAQFMANAQAILDRAREI